MIRTRVKPLQATLRPGAHHDYDDSELRATRMLSIKQYLFLRRAGVSNFWESIGVGAFHRQPAA